MKILHNPRCGKSREAVKILQDNNLNPEVVKYLDSPLNAEDLKSLVGKLGVEPIDLVRKNEKVWKENFKDKNLTAEEVIRAMAENPILMERPVIIKGDKAVIGRPPENVKSLI
ncbi:arsenate reductase (glutaredoxin) [Litoribacter ruber]|uniref:arsenate reductase (glutaredoxin) n=1 Tax=Litoribacter ruber TaxID=702568 RepID=UPI001BD92665|nr:arsenate reductase (glutaredoxin) [Litoribacter ruber]MBT0811798.1 arsenate reductase (glutaredoxin) [Litoribacter ruber]